MSSRGEIIPGNDDVLFGRGYLIQLHPGNVAFRSLVDERKAEFKRAKKIEKREIAEQIMQIMRQRNAKFLTEDATKCRKTEGLNDIQSRTWLVVEDDKALKKIMHRLREKQWVSKQASSSSLSVEAVEEETKQDPNESHLDSCSSRRRITQDTIEDNRSHLTLSAADVDCSNRNEEFLDDISCDPDDLVGKLHRGAHDSFDVAAVFESNNSQGHLNSSATFLEKMTLSDSSLGISCHGMGSHSSINLQANTRHSFKNESETSLCGGGDSSSSLLEFGPVPPNVVPIEQPCSNHFGEEMGSTVTENTITLRKWINDQVPRGLYTQVELVEYVKTALTVAIELAEMLAREDEGNPKIVLSSCAEISIVLRGNLITRVVVLNSALLCSVTDRLASLGSIFYELFSGLTPPQKDEAFSSGAGTDELGVTVNRIIGHLQNDIRRAKKRPDDRVSNRYHDELMSNLDTIGLTSSLSGLIKNLISCSQSDFRADEAYSSFNDVLADLNLVRNNPDCYLEGLSDSPTFTIPHKLYGRQERGPDCEPLQMRHMQQSRRQRQCRSRQK